MKSLLTLAAIFGSMVLLGSAAADPDRTRSTYDYVGKLLRDARFNTLYPVSDTVQEVQRRQYAEGLRNIVALLASRRMWVGSEELAKARALNLKRLLEFSERGEFTVNYDHPGKVLPCFIDSTGAICAVGYLIEQSAGRELAEKINAKYRYATIAEMKMPELDEWIASSGLTIPELITIQRPSLRPMNAETLPARTTITGAVVLTAGVESTMIDLDSEIPTLSILPPAAVDSASSVVARPESVGLE